MKKSAQYYSIMEVGPKVMATPIASNKTLWRVSTNSNNMTGFVSIVRFRNA